MRDEPVVTAATIVGAIMSLLALAVAMGWINLDPEQMAAWQKALTALVPLVLAAIGAWYARSRVTPLSNPKDDKGQKLVPKN